MELSNSMVYCGQSVQDVAEYATKNKGLLLYSDADRAKEKLKKKLKIFKLGA